MDQIRIGKFIAAERKAKGLTQQRLADALGISNKTVSKWETGSGLPEISLLMPLCEELAISVNELLSGQRLTETEFGQKAEENIMDLLREREENRKQFWLAFLVGLISTVSFLTLLLVVAVYSAVLPLGTKIVLVVIACGIFAVGLFVAMQGERTIGWYKCAHCGKTFVPNFKQYTFGMHIFFTRRLRCPHCGKKSWCKKVMSQED